MSVPFLGEKGNFNVRVLQHDNINYKESKYNVNYTLILVYCTGVYTNV